MKAFLAKHKWTIVYWIIFLSIVFYFAPKQKDYYLTADVTLFKKQYLRPVLLAAYIVACSVFFIIFSSKAKSLKQIIGPSLYLSALVGILLFIFQDLFLTGALFVNRQFKKGHLQRKYIANYYYEEPNVKNFTLYDFSLKQINNDQKLKDKLYKPSIKIGDTVFISLNRGLLGIAFPSNP